VRLETRSVGAGLLDGYAIRPVAHRDGTIYAAYEGWRSGAFFSNVTMDMVVARDDNWGSNSFTNLTDPIDGKAGRIVAAGVVINDGGFLGGERLNNDFNIAVDPNDSDTIYIVWCDNAGPNYTLRVRRSLNRGADWSGDLITVDNATLACLLISTRGTVALLYQQLVSGKWETHFRSSNDGTTWDDMLLARTATAGFIGDWTRVIAVDPHFYGVFPAMNTPDPANFFPNGGGTFHFQRTTKGTQLVSTDGTTVISASVDPFFFKVEEKDVTFILNRDPIGQDEVDARRKQPPGSSGGLPIKDALRVVADGFTAAELGLTGPGSTLPNLPVVSPGTGITISASTPIANTADNGDYGTEIQRFTFYYDIDFSDGTDPAFNFVTQTKDLILNVTAGGVPASAVLTLIKQPDPFLLHGDPAWLSIDLRIFVVRPNEKWFGATMGGNASAAPDFIQQVMGMVLPGANHSTTLTSFHPMRTSPSSTSNLRMRITYRSSISPWPRYTVSARSARPTCGSSSAFAKLKSHTRPMTIRPVHSTGARRPILTASQFRSPESRTGNTSRSHVLLCLALIRQSLGWISKLIRESIVLAMSSAMSGRLLPSLLALRWTRSLAAGSISINQTFAFRLRCHPSRTVRSMLMIPT
jgi:hypothetical protein